MITDDKLEEVNILLCEDDESLGMLLREYLEAKGYNTTLCQDGEEGFDTFLQGNFNLCILDVMMPRMDGFTLAGKIKEMNNDMPLGGVPHRGHPAPRTWQKEQGSDHPSDWQIHVRHPEADVEH